MKSPQPAQRFSVGDYLADEMDARGMSMVDLIRESRLTGSQVKGLFNGETVVTQMIAFRLAAVFGTSINVWVDLDRSYRRWKASQP